MVERIGVCGVYVYTLYTSVGELSCLVCFFFQAEDGIRDAQESRGLGDVYKRQCRSHEEGQASLGGKASRPPGTMTGKTAWILDGYVCLLYTSDAADDLLCVDLGGRRIIKKKKPQKITIKQIRLTLHLS